jgi:carbonic anhydrase
MHQNQISRRCLLASVAGTGLATAISAVGQSAPESEQLSPECKEALEILKAGNQRFVNGETRHAHEAAQWRRHLVEGQRPIATILGCSDSRVPPELVFDQGFGDLFVVRVAGNIIEPAVFGSISYAVEHLKTVLFVVLGHQKCGAVTAALDGVLRKAGQPQEIERLLEYVKPAIAAIDPALPVAQQVELGVEANVRFAMKQMAETPEGQRALREKRIAIAGGVYELETGTVRFLDGR